MKTLPRMLLIVCRCIVVILAILRPWMPQSLKSHLVLLFVLVERSWAIAKNPLRTFVKVHRTYQGAIERGERNVSIENMLKIAEACEKELSELITEAEKKCRCDGID